MKSFEVHQQKDLFELFSALQNDLANLSADVAALDTAIDTLVAKLNLDAGVTDTDYAGASAMTSGTLNLQD